MAAEAGGRAAGQGLAVYVEEGSSFQRTKRSLSLSLKARQVPFESEFVFEDSTDCIAAKCEGL